MHHKDSVVERKSFRYMFWAGLVVLMLVAAPALAIPGPEVGGEDRLVEIKVREINGPVYDITQFRANNTAADPGGWDFGSRVAYFCAWMEFMQPDQSEIFELHYELVVDYPFPSQINDRNGNESPDNAESTALCGDGSFGASQVWDGTDHHPHGTQLDFFYNGVQVSSVDYNLELPGGCDLAYWVAGDEPGEVWLWWDPDGPEESMPGVPLNCGSGGAEPFVVLRAWVQNAVEGVTVCTRDSMDGDICGVPGGAPAPAPSPSPSLSLSPPTDPRCLEHPDALRCQ